MPSYSQWLIQRSAQVGQWVVWLDMPGVWNSFDEEGNMLKILGNKRIISIFIISLTVLFVFGSGSKLEAVLVEKCWEAYGECMGAYGGYLPSPYNLPALGYCGIGVAFCILYM